MSQTKPLPFTFTNESITIIHNGKPTVVQKGAANFLALRNAIIEENWDEAVKHLTIKKSIKQWAKGKFKISDDGESVYYEDKQVPTDINARIIEMATRNEDPTPLFNFWERLQKNPSYRSVKQLFPFLNHRGIPFTEDGCFLAYKGVRRNYKDEHSGTFDNSPGAVHEMPRNKISDDPNEACHEGFHVGALEYAQGFSDVVVICKVAPEDVVCVPYDSSQQKMRVCKYEVVGNYGSVLPSTVYDNTKASDWEKPMFDREIDENDSEDFDSEQEPDVADDRSVPKKFKKIHALPMEELLKKSIDDLRRYATYGLRIVGASKIPGGKTTLVARILDVRGDGIKGGGT